MKRRGKRSHEFELCLEGLGGLAQWKVDTEYSMDIGDFQKI